MTIPGWLLILVFLTVLLTLTKPVGLWLFALYGGRRTPLHAVFGSTERGFYRLAGIDPAAEMSWRRYAVHMLAFHVALTLLTYAVLRCQAWLPLNAPGVSGIGPDGAFNTVVSFATNTNWQWYSGEAAMSNFSQMLGLTLHNFTSAATGIALAFALFRGFARRQASGIGNFWADTTRVTLYLLLLALANRKATAGKQPGRVVNASLVFRRRSRQQRQGQQHRSRQAPREAATLSVDRPLSQLLRDRRECRVWQCVFGL